MDQYDGYFVNRREEVGAVVPPGVTSVLDVGCGMGGFGITLRERLGASARVVGVDAVASSVEHARSLGVFDEVHEGYFPEALGPGPERFDLVTFNDVLEHVVDPWEMLRQTRQVLAPGGRVLAAIPNIQAFPVLWGLVRGRFEYADSGILDRTHVRFFTRSSMVSLFEQSGYVVESLTPANTVVPYARSAPRVVRSGTWRLREHVVQPLLGSAGWVHFLVLARPVS